MSNSLTEVIALTGEKRLKELLKHHYGMELQQAFPVRGILRLKTDQGNFVLKRVRKGEKDRWKLIDELAQHVTKVRSKKAKIPAPILTSSGTPFFHGYRYSYVLLPWIEAKPFHLMNIAEWKRVSRALARFHLNTRGFVPSQSFRKYEQIGKYGSIWQNAHRQVEIYQLAAKWTTFPTEADKSWLDTAAYTRGLMENLLEYYQKLGGDSLSKDTIQHGKVCHGNLHRQNLLKDDNRHIYFIDWNDTVLDVRTNDLAQWLLYAYGSTGSKEVLSTVLQSYQEVSPLEEPEYALIYARFLFPKKLFHVLSKVYQTETLSIQSAAPIIHSTSQLEEKKEGLLKQYVSLVKEQFKVTIPQLDWLQVKS